MLGDWRKNRDFRSIDRDKAWENETYGKPTAEGFCDTNGSNLSIRFRKNKALQKDLFRLYLESLVWKTRFEGIDFQKTNF